MIALPDGLYTKATFRAIAPFAIGSAAAISVTLVYFQSIEGKTVFLLQRWLVAAFFLNSSIIFVATLEWAINELPRSDHGKLAATLGVVSVLVCGAEAMYWLEFFTKKCNPNECADVLRNQLHASEARAWVIFFLFLALDTLIYWRLKSLANPTTMDVHRRSFYRRCIWIVDLPVVIIVGVVLWSRDSLVRESVQVTTHGTSVLRDVVRTMQVDGPPLSIYGSLIGDSFAVGAILGHIMLSQMAFTFLKWEYYVSANQAPANFTGAK
jgi:hypothetical protein